MVNSKNKRTAIAVIFAFLVLCLAVSAFAFFNGRNAKKAFAADTKIFDAQIGENVLEINGGSYWDSLQTETSVNWYKITVLKEGLIHFSLTPAVGYTDKRYYKVTLYNSSKTSLLGQDYSITGTYDNTNDLQFNYLGVSAGDYYIAIEKDEFFTSETYKLTVATSSSSIFEQEGNATNETATEIFPCDRCAGNFFFKNDIDWFKVNVKEAKSYAINLSFRGKTTDTINDYECSVYDANLQCIATQAFLAGSSNSMVLDNLSVGTYYIRLKMTDGGEWQKNQVYLMDFDCAHSLVMESITQSTCEERGTRVDVCTICQSKFVTLLPATGHNYGLPTYTWAEDYSTLTATRVCATDSSHTETETVSTDIIQITKPATCAEEGQAICQSQPFTNSAFETQTTNIILPKEHNYNITYTWAEDNSTLTATGVCGTDSSHVITETVEVEAIFEEVTCETDGQFVYQTKPFANSLFETQTKIVEFLPKLGHSYGLPTYTWANDYSTVTATRVCENDPQHTETEIVSVQMISKIFATCEKDGEIVYKSNSFTNTAFETQSNAVAVPKLGHNYGTPVYTWAEDYSSVSAVRVCATDSSHVETEVVTTKIVSKQTFCETEGQAVYQTNAFTNSAFVTQTKTGTLPATGHDYTKVLYAWVKDKSTFTATRVCKNDTSHVETETVGVSATYALEIATCTKDGKMRYESDNFENPAFESQTVEVVVPAKGHRFGEPTYSWTEQNTKVVARRKCESCKLLEEEWADAEFQIDEQPTCDTNGKKTCTSHNFENEAFSIQTKQEAVAPLGHNYSKITYTWKDDLSEVTAVGVCERNNAHQIRETQKAESRVVTYPTCTDKGKMEYFTSEFRNSAFASQVKEVAITESGHKFEYQKTVAPNWAEKVDGYDIYVCKKDSSHTKKENVVSYHTLDVKINFKTNGGYEVAQVVGGKGENLNLPTCEKEGYYFEGWYTDEALTNRVDGNTNLTADTTLYAKWVEIESQRESAFPIWYILVGVALVFISSYLTYLVMKSKFKK